MSPKSRLQEWAHREKSQTPTYQLIDSIGPDHAKHFVVSVAIAGETYGCGEGESKKQAEKAAAAAAIKKIEQQR